MMKKHFVLSLVMVLMAALTVVVMLAQNSVDDHGTSNDPLKNERANACYTGGSLAGKCNEEWKWVCGWGIIRVEEGLLPRQVLSAACQSLMPALAPTYTPQPRSAEVAATAVPFPSNTPEPK
jgi:hypothetical protein